MSVKNPKKNSKTEEDTSKDQSSNVSAEIKISENDRSTDDWLDTVEMNSSQSKVENSSIQNNKLSTQESTEISSIDELLADFTRQLPRWVNKPWMYVKPTHEGHLANWLDSWKQLILKYTNIFTKHIIAIYDLQNLHPFTHENSGKELGLDELKNIIDHMVEENLAKWLDDKTSRARIYFKTDHEWADILYQFTIDHGYATDIMTLYELQNLDQIWSKLPDSELQIVLSILVEQDKAEWVGNEKDTVQFKI